MDTITCAKCGSTRLKVFNSRKCAGTVYRRRLCLECGERFTTYEVREDDMMKMRKLLNNLNKLCEATEAVKNDFFGEGGELLG